MTETRFELFHAAVADALYGSTFQTGLPGYLGIETVEVAPGRMWAKLSAKDELKTPFGSLHGGVLSALVDHVLGAVLYPVIPLGSWAATTEFKVNLIRPVRDGEVVAESRIAALGRRSAVVTVEVTNDGRTVGLAQGTVTILPPADGAGVRLDESGSQQR